LRHAASVYRIAETLVVVFDLLNQDVDFSL
jgi:hypothetical protein